MIAWLFGLSTDLGVVSPWNPVIADRYAAGTERMLLGCVIAGSKRVQTHYQFWQQVGEK